MVLGDLLRIARFAAAAACAASALLIAGCSGLSEDTTATGKKAEVVAAGSSTGAGQSGKDAKVGQAIRVTGPDKLDASVTLVSAKPNKKGKGEFASPPEKGTYVVADVLVAVKGGRYAVNPLYLKYQAADGTTFDSTTGNAITAGFDPQLAAGDIAAGQRTRGFVTFDVPAGAGGKVHLTDELGSVVGQWAL